MYSSYNPKLVELQQVIQDISTQEQNLTTNPSTQEKAAIEERLNKLTERKEALNEELADSEDLSEAIKMKYAIMLLMNFGGSDPEYCI